MIDDVHHLDLKGISSFTRISYQKISIYIRKFFVPRYLDCSAPLTRIIILSFVVRPNVHSWYRK